MSIPGVYTGVSTLMCTFLAVTDQQLALLANSSLRTFSKTKYEPGILINIYDLPSNFTGYVARKYSLPSLPACRCHCLYKALTDVGFHLFRCCAAVLSRLHCAAGPAVWSG